MKTLYEYVWLDSDGETRSKIKISQSDVPEIWSYDGSSTGQAETSSSDIKLIPVKIWDNPFHSQTRINKKLVLCDSSLRENCVQTVDYQEFLFGIEQEYIIFRGKEALGINECDDKYNSYCAVGGNRSYGRKISEKHLKLCYDIGLNICGTNSEVTPGQWEFQLGILPAVDISDELIVARYILNRVAEEEGMWINYHPKPLPNHNGSGGHVNFSTKNTREIGTLDECIKLCQKLQQNQQHFLQCYGKDNHLRLLGSHEAPSIQEFTYGVGARNCSVRITPANSNGKYTYLEDRRPASNLNPYLVTSQIIKWLS